MDTCILSLNNLIRIAMLWSCTLHFPFFTKLFQTPCTSRHVSEWTTIQLQYLEEVITLIETRWRREWLVVTAPRSTGQENMRTPLLCILEPINKVSIGSENILCKISDLNFDFDYVLQNGSRIMFRHEDETREYQNKLTTLHGTRELLGPYSLRARTTKINSCLDLYFGRSL